MQDDKGNLRAATLLRSTDKWNTSSDHYNLTTAKPGSPLSASCIEFDDGSTPGRPIQTGRYVRSTHLLCDVQIDCPQGNDRICGET